MGSLNQPLQQLVEARQPKNVLCPTRLDNRVLLETIKRPDTRVYLFLAPTLRVCGASKSKFPEGSLILYLYNYEPTPHPNALWLNVSFLPGFQVEHNEEAYRSPQRSRSLLRTPVQ